MGLTLTRRRPAGCNDGENPIENKARIISPKLVIADNGTVRAGHIANYFVVDGDALREKTGR
jgi:hypothetical protein